MSLVNRASLDSAVGAAAGEDGRLGLRAVNVRTDGFVEATDGHIAIVVRVGGGKDAADYPRPNGSEYGPVEGSVQIGADTVKQILKALPKNGGVPILNNAMIAQGAGDARPSVHVVTMDSASKFGTEDYGRSYPNISKVIPLSDKRTDHAGMDPKLLKLLCESAIKAGLDTILIETFGPHTAWKATGRTVEAEWTAVIMPKHL